MNINSKSDEIYELLKKYLQRASKYNPDVLDNVIDNKYPLVVFETNKNDIDSISQDKYRLDQVRNLSFEISVFAININEISSIDICEEISNLVCEVMSVYYGMQGGIDAKLKNINNAKATKYVLHFNCKWNVRQNIIY